MAQIERMAEIEAPDDDEENNGINRKLKADLAIGSYPKLVLPVPDVLDALNKELDFVQSMCEQAAHRFLRDGNSDEEVSKLKKSLTETAKLAAKG
ncbi:hypothetical protein ACKVWC_011413 [Pyricularia oryzae]